jgi:hypothetical protein
MNWYPQPIQQIPDRASSENQPLQTHEEYNAIVFVDNSMQEQQGGKKAPAGTYRIHGPTNHTPQRIPGK